MPDKYYQYNTEQCALSVEGGMNSLSFKCEGCSKRFFGTCKKQLFILRDDGHPH